MLERLMPVQFDNLNCGFTSVTSIIGEKMQKNLRSDDEKNESRIIRLNTSFFFPVSCKWYPVGTHDEKNIDDWTISNVARMEFKKVKYNFLLFIHLE